MAVFFIVLGSMLLGDVAFWLWADRKLRRTRRRMLWRPLVGLFASLMLGYLVFLVAVPTQGRQAHAWMPTWSLAAIYVWHLLVLPATLLYISMEAVARVARSIRSRFRRRATIEAPSDLGFADPTLTRRQALLAGAAAAVPPLLTFAGTAAAMRQVHRFRVRPIELPLASLPPELDGMTIAHVTDLHVGRWTRGEVLPRIADATNALKADLVLMTGDLIDLALADLPAALDFVRRLDPRHGLYMCEGNHDLLENRFAFESRVREAEVGLLLDKDATLTLRGRTVQVLGMTWGRGESAIVGSMSNLLPLRRPDAFQVLLAHHPHAFDTAAAVGIPLTLAGHTHGGQLMLNERLGAGPVLFRYWSGVYRKSASALVVSNGVGNWFPVRTNAPAEIIHLTLRSSAST